MTYEQEQIKEQIEQEQKIKDALGVNPKIAKLKKIMFVSTPR